LTIPGLSALTEHTRSLLRQLLAMGQTRLEMLGLAVEQEVAALREELRLAAICIIAGWLAGACLIVCVALAFPRYVALSVLGVLCLALIITSVVSWRVLQRMGKRERLFSSLANQLRLDAKALAEPTPDAGHD
jgi:uncharacterized membrane protein YqjE